MMEFFFEPARRVLMARVTGLYDLETMTRFDDFVRKFVARYGQVDGLYDFSNIDQITVPMTRLAERAQQPSIAGGRRILVAPKVIGLGMTRSFSEWQSDAGQEVMTVVGTLEEAYVLLGLDYKAKFEPVIVN